MYDLLRMHDNVNTPLIVVLIKIGAFWCVSMIGYYLVLPAFGVDLSYNSAPIFIAAYFLLWTIFCIIYFWDLFSAWLVVDTQIWTEVIVSLLFSTCVWILLYLLSQTKVFVPNVIASYPDILFARPWYFLPKSVDILLQQVLVTVSVLKFSHTFKSFHQTLALYAITFGGAHAILYMLVDSPIPYARFMTLAAVLSTLIFPPLILKVRNGFVYAFMIHFTFYVVFAMTVNAWPPPLYNIDSVIPQGISPLLQHK